MSDILTALSQTLAQRKAAGKVDDSYVAQLHAKGLNKILEKLGEECIETILAAKDAQTSGDKNDLIYETADLWFHSMVMLSHLDIDHGDVLNELAHRFDLSGLAEKASRTK